MMGRVTGFETYKPQPEPRYIQYSDETRFKLHEPEPLVDVTVTLDGDEEFVEAFKNWLLKVAGQDGRSIVKHITESIT